MGDDSADAFGTWSGQFHEQGNEVFRGLSAARSTPNLAG